MKENYWLRQPEELDDNFTTNHRQQQRHNPRHQHHHQHQLQHEQHRQQKELRDDNNHQWPLKQHDINEQQQKQCEKPVLQEIRSEVNNGRLFTGDTCCDCEYDCQNDANRQSQKNQITEDNLNNNNNNKNNNNNNNDHHLQNTVNESKLSSRLVHDPKQRDSDKFTRSQQEPERDVITCDINGNGKYTVGVDNNGSDPLVDITVPVQQRGQVKKDENKINLSFCGCGFLGIYHVGVASCFHQYAPQLSMHKIAGSSAGALVAVAHICGNLQLAYATTDILRVAIDARARALGPFHPSFDINATVREALERGLPDDVHLKANGKLHISLTRVYDGANVVINEFESKDEVIQALLCSCFIPFWSGLQAPKFRGTTYIDGGFSNNQLILDNKTVAVSPFAGEADICPQDDSLNLLQISLSNTSFSISPNNLYRLSHALLPPAPEILSDLCEQGFADGIRFLQRMKLISCTKCLEIRSSLLVTTNGEDMEDAFTQQQQQQQQQQYSDTPVDSTHTTTSSIRLEQQEQKMIEINDDRILQRRKNSVSNTTSSPASTTTTTTTTYGRQSSATTNKYQQQHYQSSEHCNDCVMIRQKALYDPLPAQFRGRIRDACDAVNKSLSNWIYSYRPVKYLSYLAFTPVDVSLALVLRCWQELPLIRSELINFICNMAKFLLNLIRQILTRSTSALLMDNRPALTIADLDGDAVEYEKEIAHLKSLKGAASPEKAEDASVNCATATNNCCHHRRTNHHHHLLHHNHDNSGENMSEKGVAAELPMFLFPPPAHHPNTNESNNLASSSHGGSTTQLHSLEDTFDSIVDVTSNQEARIFAYYFRDAKNRLQVTEIFDLERAAELSKSTTSLNSLHLHNTTN